jgi:hypothetical protein
MVLANVALLNEKEQRKNKVSKRQDKRRHGNTAQVGQLAQFPQIPQIQQIQQIGHLPMISVVGTF